MYEVFHRTWWVADAYWPNGRKPGIGKSHHIKFVATEKEAQEACKEWNENNEEGPLSDRAEFKWVEQ